MKKYENNVEVELLTQQLKIMMVPSCYSSVLILLMTASAKICVTVFKKKEVFVLVFKFFYVLEDMKRRYYIAHIFIAFLECR